MARRPHLAHALVLGSLLAGTACGSDTGRPPGGAAAKVTSSAPTGDLTVLAAASLTESFNDLKSILGRNAPGWSLVYSFGSSGALATQLEQGAPADVVATADTATMKRLTDADLVEAPLLFARNTLAILVAPGNPKGIHALADLARADLKVVLADDSVPAGRYAAQVLQRAGTTVRAVSKELDVKSAVTRVTLGEADATIAYATDIAAVGTKGQGVAIPAELNVVAEYPIAVVQATDNHPGASAFVDEVVHGTGQDALRARGFLPAAA